MGGAHVFPGGRVDEADGGGDDGWCDGIDYAVGQLPGVERTEAVAYHVAAVRESFEEAGILLARDGQRRIVSLASRDAHERFREYRADIHDGRDTLRAMAERERVRLALDALVLFAHWVTPPIDTRQFDTRFFTTRAPPDQTPAHDESETTHSTWLTPGAALAAAVRGEIVLPPPTWTTLRELERFKTVDDVLAWARVRHVTRRQPKVLDEGGRRMLLLPGDREYPEAMDTERPVETRFVLIDKRWRAESS